MREIKFRAWDWVEKQMYPVIVEDFQDTQAKLFCRFPKSGTQGIIDADHLMQYIGAKDKNGIEIYEGDVIALRGKRQRRSSVSMSQRDRRLPWRDASRRAAMTRMMEASAM